jgi:hypothetical protein
MRIDFFPLYQHTIQDSRQILILYSYKTKIPDEPAYHATWAALEELE